MAVSWLLWAELSRLCCRMYYHHYYYYVWSVWLSMLRCVCVCLRVYTLQGDFTVCWGECRWIDDDGHPYFIVNVCRAEIVCNVLRLILFLLMWVIAANVGHLWFSVSTIWCFPVISSMLFLTLIYIQWIVYIFNFNFEMRNVVKCVYAFTSLAYCSKTYLLNRSKDLDCLPGNSSLGLVPRSQQQQPLAKPTLFEISLGCPSRILC